MLLITPETLAQMLCPGEYKSFLASMLPSVPDRTRRNLKKGAQPSRKTTDTIVKDICSASRFNEDEVRAFLGAQSSLPWKNAIAGLKKGMGGNYPSSFDYAAELIVRIEGVPFKAMAARQQRHPRWRDHFKRTGLLPEVMPESFVQTCFEIEKAKKKKGERVVPLDSGRVLLRTNLFLLAALEVSLMHSDWVRRDVGLWGHKLMPHYSNEKLIEPIRELFEAIKERAGIASLVEFAEKLPALTVPDSEKNIESQRRQIIRWVSGVVAPSWENVRLIRDTFFDGDDGVMFSYGVARFLQSLLADLRGNHIPTFFADERELVLLF